MFYKKKERLYFSNNTLKMASLDDVTYHRSDREQMLLKVEQLLHKTYSSIADLSTQQHISDVLAVLEEANMKIMDPVIKVHQLKIPSTNLNRKGMHSEKGVKSRTQRL